MLAYRWLEDQLNRPETEIARALQRKALPLQDIQIVRRVGPKVSVFYSRLFSRPVQGSLALFFVATELMHAGYEVQIHETHRPTKAEPGRKLIHALTVWFKDTAKGEQS